MYSYTALKTKKNLKLLSNIEIKQQENKITESMEEEKSAAGRELVILAPGNDTKESDDP